MSTPRAQGSGLRAWPRLSARSPQLLALLSLLTPTACSCAAAGRSREGIQSGAPDDSAKRRGSSSRSVPPRSSRFRFRTRRTSRRKRSAPTATRASRRVRSPACPSVKTCMICHADRDRPAADPAGHGVRGQGRRDSVAARLRLHARGARAVQSRAAHPRQRRLRDLPRRHRATDGRPAQRRSQHGVLRELSSAEERAERLFDLSLTDGPPILHQADGDYRHDRHARQLRQSRASR